MRVYGSVDSVTRRKTTIEVSNPLLEEAKRVTTRDKTTLRELVEAGLRAVREERRRRERFRLRSATFRGAGLSEELKGADWDRIRKAASESRGG